MTSGDRDHSIEAWVDHLEVPRWVRRETVTACAACKLSFAAGFYSHCRLCGLLYCRPCTQRRILPPRFERKGKQGISRVCHDCVAQVLDRKLSLLSQAAQFDRQPEVLEIIVKPMPGYYYPDPTLPDVTTNDAVLHVLAGVSRTASLPEVLDLLATSYPLLRNATVFCRGVPISDEHLELLSVKHIAPVMYIGTPGCLQRKQQEERDALTEQIKLQLGVGPSDSTGGSSSTQHQQHQQQHQQQQQQQTIKKNPLSILSSLGKGKTAHLPPTTPTSSSSSSSSSSLSSSSSASPHSHSPATTPLPSTNDISVGRSQYTKTTQFLATSLPSLATSSPFTPPHPPSSTSSTSLSPTPTSSASPLSSPLSPSTHASTSLSPLPAPLSPAFSSSSSPSSSSSTQGPLSPPFSSIPPPATTLLTTSISTDSPTLSSQSSTTMLPPSVGGTPTSSDLGGSGSYNDVYEKKVALYTYKNTRSEPGYLSFVKGEEFMVRPVRKNGKVSTTWLYGRAVLDKTKKGFLPTSYFG